jgi:hypothetical protein
VLRVLGLENDFSGRLCEIKMRRMINVLIRFLEKSAARSFDTGHFLPH